MKIQFLGAVQTVTGSKYLLTIEDKKILVDCGLFQGLKELRLRNWAPFVFDPKSIDAVLLTHSHIDHSGALPLLVKNGFTGPIYCTAGTRDLCEVLLRDSAYLQEEEANYANRHHYSKHHPALPLYTVLEAEHALKQFVTCPYDKDLPLTANSHYQFLRAGHIIGSSMVRIQANKKSILFTGDLGRPHDLVMKAPEVVQEVDYLIAESTYGDREHDKRDPCEKLEQIINRTVDRGGLVIIPAFAVGRTQIVLYLLSVLKKQRRIPNIPIYLDSPMAINATTIFSRYPFEHRLNAEELHDMEMTATYINSASDSKKIDSYHEPMIILSSSGMASGGRVLHHIKRFAPDAKNTILFTGYQAVETRGARMMNGEKRIKMLGEMVPINAEVAMLDNISAHADATEMLQWLSHFKKAPTKVFVTHGEEQAALALQEKIQNKLNWQVSVPKYLESEELI